MTDTSVITYLKIIGWAAILTYPLDVLARMIREFSITNARGNGSEDLLLPLTELIGGLLTMPTALALPVLCLFAARYLTKNPDTLETIFE